MYSDNWSTKFMIDKIDSHNINTIKQIEINFSEIIRKEGLPFNVFTISLDSIELSLVKKITDKYSNLEIIVNIKKEYKINADALTFLHSKNISFGGLGDLSRFAGQKDNAITIDKEYDYISRGLRQHRKVKSFERLDNKRLLIHRYLLKDVTAIFINDYEVSIESVRSSIDVYQNFQIIVKTNPNGRITNEANNLAKSLNIEICSWGDFLGKLNSQWK